MYKSPLFLRTRVNDVWISMQEILPMIENNWREIYGDHLEVVNVDEDAPQKHLKKLLKADLLVVSAFNLKIINFILTTRKKLGLDIPMAFYLHSQATVALWPMVYFDLWESMSKKDFFLGTCEGDLNCLRAINSSNDELPLIQTLFNSKSDLNHLPKLNPGRPKDILYIGRLSHQKNLGSLLKTFLKLNEEVGGLTLHLYGKEDFLGSPNMKLSGSGYKEELLEISRNNPKIIFHGFVDRDVIRKEWSDKPFIHCTPSLHSDENFGMAVLMGLEMGGKAVISEWGGHKNFIKEFPDRVTGVPIRLDSSGMKLDDEKLYLGLKNALVEGLSQEVESPFNSRNISQKLKSDLEIMAKKIGTLEGKLEVPELTAKILKQRSDFSGDDKVKAQKIFSGYDDPLAHIFFKAYGAKPIE